MAPGRHGCRHALRRHHPRQRCGLVLPRQRDSGDRRTTVPPHGRAHRLKIGTADLEDVVSRRAILARYLAGPNVRSTTDLDVQDVFDRSRGGDEWATQVLEDAFRALGGALAPWFTRFQATTVAFGGAMTGSWDLVLPPLRSGLTTAGARIDIELLPSADTERSALVGAATYAHPVKV